MELGTIVPAEFEMEKESSSAVEYTLQVSPITAKSYHGAKKITSGGHSARVCTNELVNFQKLKIIASIKTNVGHLGKINSCYGSYCTVHL